MPRPKRNKTEIKEMRERFLQAAVDLLHEQGPTGLSVRAVSERVGVSHMMLYSYFENYHCFTAALRKRYRAKARERHSQRLEQARQGEAEVVLRQLFQESVGFCKDHPEIFAFLWSGKGQLEIDPDANASEGVKAEVRNVADLIELGMDQGAFTQRDPVLAAMMVLSLVNGSMLMFGIPDRFPAKDKYALEQNVVEVAMSYLKGNV